MKYFVEDIVFVRSGETRTDGRYPNRIGSEIEFLYPVKVGYPCVFRYIKYNNGELVEDHITRTSVVNDYDSYSKEGYLYLYTRNSVYILKEVLEFDK